MDASTAQDLRDGDGLRQDVPCAILRGTARGLEMVVDARAPLEAIVDALEARLSEAPGFFRGSDVRVTVENGPLAVGTLSRLDALAQDFELRIVEVAAPRARSLIDAIPATPAGAVGSVPVPVDANGIAPPPNGDAASDAIVNASVEAQPVSALVAAEADGRLGTRVVEGPIRSGAILDHVGHLIIFGDVNPGAEVRATGNIVVLGCLRGTAHAGIGRDTGFILALQLEPQQLRIGRKVARADANTRASNAEIAYATGTSIVVERYSGRLPRNLSASI